MDALSRRISAAIGQIVGARQIRAAQCYQVSVCCSTLGPSNVNFRRCCSLCLHSDPNRNITPDSSRSHLERSLLGLVGGDFARRMDNLLQHCALAIRSEPHAPVKRWYESAARATCTDSHTLAQLPDLAQVLVPCPRGCALLRSLPWRSL